MKYGTILDAAFLSRLNRFIAKVLLDGKEETVHVKNTGRCKELLLPGADVRLEVSENPAHKTKYDLVAVRKKGLGWVNIDSQAPNKMVKEWLETKDCDAIHSEFSYYHRRSIIAEYTGSSEQEVFDASAREICSDIMTGSHPGPLADLLWKVGQGACFWTGPSKKACISL